MASQKNTVQFPALTAVFCTSWQSYVSASKHVITLILVKPHLYIESSQINLVLSLIPVEGVTFSHASFIDLGGKK